MRLQSKRWGIESVLYGEEEWLQQLTFSVYVFMCELFGFEKSEPILQELQDGFFFLYYPYKKKTRKCKSSKIVPVQRACQIFSCSARELTLWQATRIPNRNSPDSMFFSPSFLLPYHCSQFVFRGCEMRRSEKEQDEDNYRRKDGRKYRYWN